MTTASAKLTKTEIKTLARINEVGSISDLHHRLPGMHLDALVKLLDKGLLVRGEDGMSVHAA